MFAIMETIQSILVDDDPGDQQKLKFYIDRMPFVKLKKSFTNAREAFAFLKAHPVDLVFLDLMMDEFSGLQLLESLQNRPYVIITTGYQEYTLKAYELNVQDYLLKPYSFDRFVRAVNRIYDLMVLNQNNGDPADKPAGPMPCKDYFFVRNNYKMLKVRFCDIYYIQGLSNYLIIKTNNGSIFTLQGFKEILSLLPADQFMRVHRSYVIALDKIEYIQKNKIKIGDHMIPIGESYKQMFMEHLRRYHLI